MKKISYLFLSVLFLILFCNYRGLSLDNLVNYKDQDEEVVLKVKPAKILMATPKIPKKAKQEEKIVAVHKKEVKLYQAKGRNETYEERKKRIDKTIKELLAYGEPQEVRPTGPHMWVGKRAEWVINNFVRPDGWQLTGWSKVTLDENFNPIRLKIGIITPEICESRISSDHYPDEWDEFEKFQHHEDTDVTFGVFWSRSW